MPSHLTLVRKSKFTTIEIWSIVILVLLSFTGISVAQIGKAMLTPLHLCMGFLIGYGFLVSKKSEKKLSFSLVLFMGYVLLVNILQYPNIRYTSVLYTLIYGLEVTILYNMLRRCRPEAFIFALKLIVYLYFINLFLGFTLDTLGIRHPAIGQLIKVYYAEGSTSGRPMGFSSEPSYAAFILAVVFLCYSHLRKHILDSETIKMIIKIVLCIFFSKSAYGFLFIAVLVLDWGIYFYVSGGRIMRNLLPLIIICGIAGTSFLATQVDNEAIQRIVRFSTVALDNTYSGRTKMIKLQEADGSAFARIGPTYLLFTQANNKDFNFVLGQGAGAAGKFLSTFLQGILVDEGRDSVDTGIIPALIFDYGYIGGGLFLFFLIASFYRLPLPFWVLFLLILPNANINTQLIWFAVSCFLFVNIAVNKPYS